MVVASKRPSSEPNGAKLPKVGRTQAETAPGDDLAILAAMLGNGQAPQASGEVSTAEIGIALLKEVCPDKTHSVLSLDPADPTAEIHISHDVCPASELKDAAAVAFIPRYGVAGDVEVCAPIWLLRGKIENPASQIAWGEYGGVIKRISTPGDAYVGCDEVHQKFGGHDAYIFRKVKTMCHLEVGDEIRFNVHLNKQGLPQASAPIWKKHKDGDELRGIAFDISETAGPPKGASKGGSKGAWKGAPPTASSGLQAEESTGDFAIAVVKQTFPLKGFSFLTSDPNDEDQKIYIHHTVASPALLDTAQAVAFKPHINKKGELQAAAPVWLLQGKIDPGTTELVLPPHTGLITRANQVGDAFVMCQEVTELYGVEAYIYHKVMQSCKLSVGDTIRFNIHVNAKNQPQVTSPVWKKNDEADKGVFLGMPEEQLGLEGRVEAVVSEWNVRGFGFVQTSDGRRAYVHHSFIGGDSLEPGETITAVLSEDAANPGKFAAKDIIRGNGDIIGFSAGAGKGCKGGMGCVGGKGFMISNGSKGCVSGKGSLSFSKGGMKGDGKKAFGKGWTEDTDEWGVLGQTPSWDDVKRAFFKGKGCGQATKGKHAFDEWDVLGQIAKGGVIPAFGKGWDAGAAGCEGSAMPGIGKGLSFPEATEGTDEWELVGNFDKSFSSPPGRYVGVVNRIAEKTGDAYLDCPEVEAEFGHSPYVFRKIVQNCSLNVGDHVQFNLHLNASGMPQVQAPLWKKNGNKGNGKGKGILG